MTERLFDILPEFMDSLGEATLLVTDKTDWVLLTVPGFGFFVSMDEDRKKVYQISGLTEWSGIRNINIKKQEPMGTFAVRDIFPKLQLHSDPSFKGTRVEIWINAVLPSGNPINVNKIRFEAYTDQIQAFTDAEAEMNSGADVSRVVTTKVPLHLPKKADTNAQD